MRLFFSLFYLFSSALDHHWFRYQQPLYYIDYPQSITGYWWKILKDLYKKAAKRGKKTRKWQREKILQALDPNCQKEILKEIKPLLSEKEFLNFKKTIHSLYIFQKTNKEKAKIEYDGAPPYGGPILNTGISLWEILTKEFKNHPNLIRENCKIKINRILQKHPVLGSRQLFSSLKCFDKEIFSQFKKENKRWL